jgi:outer membrane lipoprotein-sorting protein
MNKNLLIPMLILIAVVLGCSRLRETATGPANSGTSVETAPESSGSGPAPEEFAPAGNPRGEIEKMAERFMAVNSYRAEMNGEGDMPMRTELEFIAPDRYRIKTGNTMEMVVIGKKTYMKLAGRWQEMDVPLDNSIADMRSSFNSEGMKWLKGVKFEREGSLNGKAAYIYTYQASAPDNSGENHSTLWLDRSNGLPLRIVATYKSGNLRSMTIDYDYETPVTIDPPVK